MLNDWASRRDHRDRMWMKFIADVMGAKLAE